MTAASARRWMGMRCVRATVPLPMGVACCATASASRAASSAYSGANARNSNAACRNAWTYWRGAIAPARARGPTLGVRFGRPLGFQFFADGLDLPGVLPKHRVRMFCAPFSPARSSRAGGFDAASEPGVARGQQDPIGRGCSTLPSRVRTCGCSLLVDNPCLLRHGMFAVRTLHRGAAWSKKLKRSGRHLVEMPPALRSRHLGTPFVAGRISMLNRGWKARPAERPALAKDTVVGHGTATPGGGTCNRRGESRDRTAGQRGTEPRQAIVVVPVSPSV